MFHLASDHSDSAGKLPQIPRELLQKMFLSMAEEKDLGVSEDITSGWRDENDVPSTEGLMEMLEEREEREKRGRSDTISTSHSQNSDFNNSKRPCLHSITEG